MNRNVLKSLGRSAVILVVLFGVLVISGCRRAPGDAPRKVLVIGLDGADFDRMNPLLDTGQLPNIKALMDRGSYGRSMSLIPSISPASWVAITSGKNPGKSGVLHFLHPEPNDRYTVFDIDAGQCAVKRIWNILSEKGKQVIVQGVPVTYPPEKVNGVMISGWLAPKNSTFTYPPELAEKLRQKGYVTFVEQVKTWGPDTPPDQYRYVIDAHKKIDEIRLQTILELMRTNPWAFCMVVFENIDHIQHVINRDLAPTATYYRWMDEVVGRIVKAAGPDTLVAVVSDHGFGRVHHNFDVRQWLQSEHLLNYRSIENITFSGSVTVSKGADAFQARPYDFEEEGDQLAVSDGVARFSGVVSYGEDGIDFQVSPGTLLALKIKAVSEDGTSFVPEMRIGRGNIPLSLENGAVRWIVPAPEQMAKADRRLLVCQGDGSDEVREEALGTVTFDSDRPAIRVCASGTTLSVFNDIRLIDSSGEETIIDCQDLSLLGVGETAAEGKADGKWWLQRWELFRGGMALVAHPGESVPPLNIRLPVKKGTYKIYLGTYTGSWEEGVTALSILLPDENGAFEEKFMLSGKPIYKPGEDAGCFLWMDGDGWHLRWNGSAKRARREVDWAHTAAWDPFWSVSPYGALFLNVKGREPKGMIPPEKYEEARDVLAKKLLSYVDPQTGKQVVIRTFKREELYQGPYVDEMPDLLFEVDSDYCIYHRVTGSHHKRDGILILSGPGIRTDGRFTASILDITPTLLYAMGQPVGEDMDGRVLTDAFTEAFRAKHPLQTVSTYEDAGGSRRRRNRDRGVSKEVESRLRALGYIN